MRYNVQICCKIKLRKLIHTIATFEKTLIFLSEKELKTFTIFSKPTVLFLSRQVQIEFVDNNSFRAS